MIKAEWTNADTLDLQPTCNNVATDCISRQAAIEITKMFSESIDAKLIKNHLSALPPAQPEIIYCKDCKHWDELLAMCKKSRRVIFGVKDFCSKAERREE